MLRLAVDLKATAGVRGAEVSRKKRLRDLDFENFPLNVNVTNVGQGHPKLLLLLV